MLLQTNSYIVPREKRAEHARLLRRFRQALVRLGCDHFEVYEQVGANWNGSETSGRFVQIMRFRDRKHQLAVQAAERNDPVIQALLQEFCELINFPYQQQPGLFAAGYYTSFLRMPLQPQPAPPAAEAPLEPPPPPDGSVEQVEEPPPPPPPPVDGAVEQAEESPPQIPGQASPPPVPEETERPPQADDVVAQPPPLDAPEPPQADDVSIDQPSTEPPAPSPQPMDHDEFSDVPDPDLLGESAPDLPSAAEEIFPPDGPVQAHDSTAPSSS